MAGPWFPGSLGDWINGPHEGGTVALLTIGSAVKTHDLTTISWARAYTQSVIASTIGQPIPLSRGSRLVKGQLLWSTSIMQETKTTTTVFGNDKDPYFGMRFKNHPFKTSPDPPPDPVTNVETTRLYVDCAIGFGQVLNSEVRARIVELRAGNVALYSRRQGATAALKSMGFELYQGSEEQLPNKLMESYLGEGNVPAYRGEAYVVFKQLDLIAFGGAFPDIYAVISDGAPTDEYPFNELLPAGGSGFRGNGAMFDPDTLTAYWLSNDGMELHVINTAGKTLLGTIPLQTSIGGLQSNLALAEWQGVFFGTDNSPLNCVPIHAMFLDTGEVADTFGFTAPSSTANLHSRFATSRVMIAQMVYRPNETPITYLVCCGIFANLGLLSYDDEGFRYQGHQNGTPNIQTGCRGPVLQDRSIVYLTDDGSKIWELSLTASLLNRKPDQVTGDLPFPLDRQTTLYDDEPWIDLNYGAIVAMHYYEPDDTIIAFVTGDDGDFVYCIDRKTTALFYKVAIAHAGANVSTTRSLSNIEFGYITWTATGVVYTLNVHNGDYSGSEGNLVVVGVNNDSDYFFDFSSGAFFAYGSNHALGYINGASTLGQRIALSTLIAELADFVGLDEDEISIDERIIDQIDGFIIQGSVGTDFFSLVRSIGEAFGFTVTEAGNGVRLVKQMVVDGAEDVTAILTPADLATQQARDFPRNEGDPFANSGVITTRTPDYDIVDLINITYSDFGYDYASNTVTRVRAKLPSEVRRKGKDLDINITPIIMRAPEATTLAANLLFQNVSKRLSHAFRLKTTQARLEPGDVIDLPAADHIIRAKLEQIIYHSDFSMSCQASDYLNSDDSMDTDGQTPITPPTPVVEDNRSQFIPIDMPLLDDGLIGNGRTSIYYAIGGMGQDGWRGANVLSSPDGGLYERVATRNQETYWGKVKQPLDTASYIDELSEMTFHLFNGDPALFTTVSRSGWYHGEMAAIVGFPGSWELVSIREFEYDEDTTLFTVRGFIRGLRDTFNNVGKRKSNEYIVFPFLGAGVGRVIQPEGSLGDDFFYKGVGVDLSSLKARSYKIVARAEAERPMSVIGVHIVKEMDDDLVFTWQPQDPLNVTINDGTDYERQSFPDNYRIDVLDGPGGAIAHTETITGARTWTYSAADQTADGFTAGAIDELSFFITQLSGPYLDGRTFERLRYVE